MTPPDRPPTESRKQALLAEFKDLIQAPERDRISMRRAVSPQKIHGSILKNRERASSHRDKSEDRPLGRVRFEPASQDSLKESGCGPEKKTASWSLRGKVKPDERQIRRSGGYSSQIVQTKDHFEALAIEVKSLKGELELMRSCRVNAGNKEGR
ncbi:hypothetical protein N7478_001343 [Penicillium angulare]|uniref:uncharacterized protein n=1 Tax=Penicillium angulare TaxID=116970 RepID=UPI0025402D59|nr:uncharacterized protein N7478_010669 [Penicillium angulare]XP_056785438.1 uncharacterized protein N7478_001343 [Penicillium angulare]KAJ5267861.1 hypothetical protein N7478_010669 [Penicillium angulare]KAJ5292092.1 hypothetical protein N7478_001343 [Penicillium angulare]